MGSVTLGDRLLRLLAVVLLLGLLAAVSLGVFFRLINRPLSWSDELAQYLLVWTGFCGWMLATRGGSHIRILVIADRFPRLPRLWLEVAVQLAMIAFGAGLLWYSQGLIRRTWDVESISLPVTAAFLYLPLPVLGLVTMGRALGDLRAALRGRLDTREGQVL